ncbi:MAG: hypothetical protein AAF687_07795 [Pseudomonadota bacterium]
MSNSMSSVARRQGSGAAAQISQLARLLVIAAVIAGFSASQLHAEVFLRTTGPDRQPWEISYDGSASAIPPAAPGEARRYYAVVTKNNGLQEGRIAKTVVDTFFLMAWMGGGASDGGVPYELSYTRSRSGDFTDGSLYAVWSPVDGPRTGKLPLRKLAANADEKVFPHRARYTAEIDGKQYYLTTAKARHLTYERLSLVWSPVENTAATFWESEITALEMSPQVEAVEMFLDTFRSNSSHVIDDSLTGFEETYDSNGEVTDNDHPSGITMTPRGRVVTTMSRVGKTARNGLLMYTNPLKTLKPSASDTTWTMKPVLAKHPSAMQAVGEIVAVASKGTKFFLLPTDGKEFQALEHLNTYYSGGESVGVTYNAFEDRFYLITSPRGGVMVSQGRITATLWRTPTGKSLLDPNTKFEVYGEVKDLLVASQGSHIVTDTDGQMHIISSFSSVEKHGEVFHDVLAYTTFDSIHMKGHSSRIRDIGVTQRAQLVTTRPAWRFGGGVAPMDKDTLVALWVSRFNWDVVFGSLDDDDFEWAILELER